MFTRILVPLDGSTLAERAIPTAAHIARQSGGTVLLVQALSPSYLATYGTAFGPYPGAFSNIEEDIAQSQAYLTRVGNQPPLAGIPVETYPVISTPAPSILRLSQERHADLVVMTSHGRSGISRWVLGSVAHHLARQSAIPVLILRAQAQGEGEHDEAQVASGPILVTLDGSETAEAVLGPAADLCVALASPNPGELRLLLVVDRYLAAMDAAPETLLVGGAEGYLSRVAERLERERGDVLRVTWSVSADTDIAAAILRDVGTAAGAAKDRPALIAMATHGRTGFARWVLGSITERVLQGAQSPLLIVRPEHVTDAASPLTLEAR